MFDNICPRCGSDNLTDLVVCPSCVKHVRFVHRDDCDCQTCLDKHSDVTTFSDDRLARAMKLTYSLMENAYAHSDIGQKLHARYVQLGQEHYRRFPELYEAPF